MILHFIVTALVIYGIKATTDPGMIFEKVYVWFVLILSKVTNEKVSGYIAKPVFYCTPCMASVYGTISFWLYFPYPSVMAWIVWVFALAGFNYIVNKITMKTILTTALLLTASFIYGQTVYIKGVEFNSQRHEVASTIDIKRNSIGFWNPHTLGVMKYERIDHYWRNGIMDHYLTDKGTIFIVKLDKIHIMNIKEDYSMVFYKNMERESIKRYIK